MIYNLRERLKKSVICKLYCDVVRLGERMVGFKMLDCVETFMVYSINVNVFRLYGPSR